MSEISVIIGPRRGGRVLGQGEVKPPRYLRAKSGPGGYLTEWILECGSGVFCEICTSTRSSLEMCSLFGSADEQSDGASRAGDEDSSANDDLS